MDIWGVIVIILNGFWLFLPAMLPNSAAVVFGKMGKTKIDFGKSWRGKRIFGDGKSWAGLFGGGFSGIFLGLILIGISALFGSPDYWGYGGFWGNIGILACLSFGAILGDLMAAFIKRRLGLERWAKAPLTLLTANAPQPANFRCQSWGSRTNQVSLMLLPMERSSDKPKDMFTLSIRTNIRQAPPGACTNRLHKFRKSKGSL